MAYDDTLRNDVVEILDSVLGPLKEEGLIISEFDVAWVVTTKTGGSATKGEPPTKTPVPTSIYPRATVVIKDVMRWVDGGLRKVGDAVVTFSRSAMTELQIDTAEWWTINGDKYTLANGWTKRDPFTWTVVLKRM